MPMSLQRRVPFISLSDWSLPWGSRGWIYRTRHSVGLVTSTRRWQGLTSTQRQALELMFL
jgi:hypothetical protein